MEISEEEYCLASKTDFSLKLGCFEVVILCSDWNFAAAEL